MTDYVSEKDFDSADPQLIGVTGDDCASCGSNQVPLYDLPCHISDDFHCRNCLTQTWYKSDDDIARCPVAACGKDCGFMPLQPISQAIHLDRNFYEAERIDKLRQQPEIMNSEIGFTSEEAMVILEHVYSEFEDQILDPLALGGVPGHITQVADQSFQVNLAFNPFARGLLGEMTAARKLTTTPYELEEDLRALLSHLLHEYAQQNYVSELARWGVDLEHEEAVLDAALANYKPLKDFKDYWEEIIKKWVDLLTWRHLERLAPPEGGAADRQYLKTPGMQQAEF
jgi:hypothetical protein